MALEALNIAHTLAPVKATDVFGEPVRFGALWESKPVVLVFIRHFG